MPSFGQPGSESLATLSSNTVLITGADGMLGRAFTESLAVFPGCRVIPLGRDRLDVTDREAVMAFASTNIEWIIHCAADVDADRCEKNPDACHAVQVGGTENVAALARACGARQASCAAQGCHRRGRGRADPAGLARQGRQIALIVQVDGSFSPRV